jgi:hypothetical protein
LLSQADGFDRFDEVCSRAFRDIRFRSAMFTTFIRRDRLHRLIGFRPLNQETSGRPFRELSRHKIRFPFSVFWCVLRCSE